jgi:hypothetical protein
MEALPKECFDRAKKERGQARLPNPELIRVEVVIAAGKAFNVKAIVQVQESRGREGGLAPALSGPNTFCAKTINAYKSFLLSLCDWNVRKIALANIFSARANEFVVGVLFEDVGRPTADATDCENRRVEVQRNSHHVIG